MMKASYPRPLTRRVLQTLAVLAAASTVAACSGGGGSNPETREINLTLASNSWSQGVIPLLPEFEKETGIKVNVATFGNDQLSDQYQVKLNAATTDIDVMAFRPAQELRLFGGNGWLADLTEEFEGDTAYNWNDVQSPARDAVTLDGKVRAAPLFTEKEVLYYNKDLLAAKGVAVPTTLDELEAAAATLNDPDNGVYGIVLRGKTADAVTSFSSFLYSEGGGWVKDGQSAISSPEAIRAYEIYGGLIGKSGPPGVMSMGWVEASAVFAQGKAAFFIDADSIGYVFADPAKSAVVDQVGYAAFPAGSAGSKPFNATAWALGVSEFSQNKEAAATFVKWATSEAMFKTIMASSKNASPRASTWLDATATAGYSAELIKATKDYGTNGVGHDRPRVIQVGKARDIVGAPIIAAIQGEDVAASAKNADQKFGAFLKDDK
jgi:multiple sugar transport system substrate-binding protein